MFVGRYLTGIIGGFKLTALLPAGFLSLWDVEIAWATAQSVINKSKNMSVRLMVCLL